MDITIGTIFSTVNAAKAVAEYTGLIESLGVKVDRLASAKLHTAMRELEHARNSSSLEEQRSALRQARVYLSEALSLERAEERLSLAYIGLGMVFSQLGEEQNCENTLAEFSSQPFRKRSVQSLQKEICRKILRRPANNPYLPSYIEASELPKVPKDIALQLRSSGITYLGLTM